VTRDQIMQALLALILLACALYFLGGLLRVVFTLVSGLVSLALAAGVLVAGLGFSTLAFNQRTPQVEEFVRWPAPGSAGSAASAPSISTGQIGSGPQVTPPDTDADLRAAIDGLTFVPATSDAPGRPEDGERNQSVPVGDSE